MIIISLPFPLKLSPLGYGQKFSPPILALSLRFLRAFS